MPAVTLSNEDRWRCKVNKKKNEEEKAGVLAAASVVVVIVVVVVVVGLRVSFFPSSLVLLVD